MVQEILFREKTNKTFEKFYKEYDKKLNGWLLKMCRDQSLAKEIADEAFIKALVDIEMYDETKSNISTWTFTIAKNLLIHRIKKGKKFESIDSEDFEGFSKSNDLVTEMDTEFIDTEYVTRQKAEIVRSGIYELPEKYMEILIMRHYDNLSYDEIQEITGLPLNTVKSRIRCGRQFLQKKISSRIEELENVGA